MRRPVFLTVQGIKSPFLGPYVAQGVSSFLDFEFSLINHSIFLKSLLWDGDRSNTALRKDVTLTWITWHIFFLDDF